MFLREQSLASALGVSPKANLLKHCVDEKPFAVVMKLHTATHYYSCAFCQAPRHTLPTTSTPGLILHTGLQNMLYFGVQQVKIDYETAA